ncbi:STAS domain-containing protein [Desulfolucanica intricata]|uniref:STAS domain-containing protein n=1 Tax=Desulfolucanica intricata TaxID=1285191 RepID=UPI00082D8F3A|nr:STAS domain-containing protein [Desulfolucanica intricata]
MDLKELFLNVNQKDMASKCLEAIQQENPRLTGPEINIYTETLSSTLHEAVKNNDVNFFKGTVADLTKETIIHGQNAELIEVVIDSLYACCVDIIKMQYPKDSEALVSLARELRIFTNGSKKTLFNTALKVQADIIKKQNMALLELSTPVIPLMENILVLPLIGTIDTTRAGQIMDNLLNSIVKYQGETVLIDISGVPIVDTQVAHHIIKAVQAARLLGARCILVGIKPEFAQTIVKLGIDFQDLVTKNSMQTGLELALEWQKYELRKKTEV